MTYNAPIEDMIFVLEELCGLKDIAKLPGLEDATPDMVAAILEEAGKFASQVLSPLNVVGDVEGLGFTKGAVTMPDGWKQAYDQLVGMGWNAPTAEGEHGGMGLPAVVNACIQEIFQGANAAYQLCPMLTQGAIEAVEGFASPALKEIFLPKLVSGEWTGTMNLTEPQAGSDLAAIRSKAEPEGDRFLISGQKIFITYGEHDLTENIIHLVLARLPDAPEGVKGISLFVVPKYLVNADGSLGERNDVRCVSIEHKLGIHASPTCTLAFGDNGGAVGYLVGAPNVGLQYMFAMMNNARLNVGLQGVGIAEQASQHATRYAMERKQGVTPEDSGSAAIIGHPDVRRMLGLMKSRTEAARILAYRAARSLDFAQRSEDANEKARHQRRVDLLIPVVKGWSTELAVENASLGLQVHGGMGYVEETGAAQYLRDARITTIYEGTTGIQALDLIGRKILRDRGKAAFEIVRDMRATALVLADQENLAADWSTLSGIVGGSAYLIENATNWILQQKGPEAQAVATDVLELFGIALGAWAMGDAALHAGRRIEAGTGSSFHEAKMKTIKFYMANVVPHANALSTIITGAAPSILNLRPNDFGAGS
ncbi:acyl-CoA dehydrogenase [Sulfitobacter sp. F26204]|uniref:acyl-CoA dehydrogenase n=1 Tax=Sulfitobacter sp. F26204 TaxID=2996014 RepID=UPI00225DD2BB|nr:acyl-CoA dehydrogenase [Sulfitobacter sp. F26204]MCX7561712.1 acyl-CoA dehydrogenase [Sulfitobacter sp. F26204]